MSRTLRTRFWIESALALLSGALTVLTLLWTDWIELVFRVDPDAGNGAMEWAIVVIALAATLAFAVLARVEYRRAALAST